MKKRFLALCLAAIIGVGVSNYFTDKWIHKEVFNLDNSDCDIYSLLLTSYHIRKNTELIVIEHNTYDPHFFDSTPVVGYMIQYTTQEMLRREMSYLQNDTLSNYVAANTKDYSLQPKFRLPIKYQFISIEERNNIFGNSETKNPWSIYHNKYPKSSGMIGFSKVGYSNDGQQALVYSEYGRNGLSGAGIYYLLCKENGHWAIEYSVFMWFS